MVGVVVVCAARTGNDWLLRLHELNRREMAAVSSENREDLARSERIVTHAKPVFRLLVVDDEPDMREVTSAMLVEEGYEVLTAKDGRKR
jgi:CheY-like chemotaxis protein